jgi:hypothetical protein
MNWRAVFVQSISVNPTRGAVSLQAEPFLHLRPYHLVATVSGHVTDRNSFVSAARGNRHLLTVE